MPTTRSGLFAASASVGVQRSQPRTPPRQRPSHPRSPQSAARMCLSRTRRGRPSAALACGSGGTQHTRITHHALAPKCRASLPPARTRSCLTFRSSKIASSTRSALWMCAGQDATSSETPMTCVPRVRWPHTRLRAPPHATHARRRRVPLERVQPLLAELLILRTRTPVVAPPPPPPGHLRGAHPRVATPARCPYQDTIDLLLASSHGRR